MTNLSASEQTQLLRDTLTAFLSHEGFQIMVAGDSASALRLAREQNPDLILLDLNLDSATSEQLCQCMQGEGTAPVVILTTRRGVKPAAQDESPASHDCDGKPFASDDLVAHLRAALRRTEQQPYPRILSSGDLVLDLLSRRAVRAGQALNLTPKEFHLLAEFVQHRGVLLSRAQLFELVWGVNYAGDRRTLDVHISWLRKKIEQNAERPQRITTVRNLGYRFES